MTCLTAKVYPLRTEILLRIFTGLTLRVSSGGGMCSRMVGMSSTRE